MLTFKHSRHNYHSFRYQHVPFPTLQVEPHCFGILVFFCLKFAQGYSSTLNGCFNIAAIIYSVNNNL